MMGKKENGEEFILEKLLKTIMAGTGRARVNIFNRAMRIGKSPGQ
jgi:hypothetical protein